MKKKINIWAAIGVALLYPVLVFVSAFVGFLSPLCWAYFTVLAALLAVGPYFWLASRWQNFGVGTVLALLICSCCFVTGEIRGFLSIAIFVGLGILSDVIRMFVGYSSPKGLSVAYPFLAVANVAWIIRLWTMPQWYVEGAKEEMGEAYAQGIVAFQSPLHFVLVVIITAAAAVLAVRLAGRFMKKSYSLLDSDKGLLSKIFSNARKPHGFWGRMMVAGMNGGSHAAMAEWGIAFAKFPIKGEIIEIGCGGGANIARILKLCPEAKVTGVDYSSVSVAKSRAVNADAIKNSRCDVVEASVLSLPFNDASFNMATAFETVYFWPDIQKSLAEVFRVLAPGAQFIIVNEDDGLSGKNEKWEKMIDGMHTYTPDELKNLLAVVGFRNITVHRNESKQWLCVTAIK